MPDETERPVNRQPVESDVASNSLGAPPEPWKPRVNPWLIALVVATAAFMEVLDTSIANVALPYIAGNLGASGDESTWVLTSYLVSNAIVLPISGWFASLIGRKRFFMLCLFIFTVSSLLCGIAPSLGTIILFRVLQGAGGGGLQPMAQAIMADSFPPEKRGLAFAVYGITTIIAPTIGPTLGGWITDNYTWRWIFFINLPVGLLAIYLVYRLIDDPPWFKRLSGAGIKFDYIGVGLLTLGIGSLQIMLDKGQEDDWFGSHFILTLAILAATGLVSLVIWEWVHKEPIIDVRMFKDLNFLRKFHDVRAGDHVVFKSRDDAAIFANSDGLHCGIGWPGAFRRRSTIAISHANCRHSCIKNSSQIYHCVRLDYRFCRDVLFHAALGPRYQFCVSEFPTGHASLRTWVPVRSD